MKSPFPGMDPYMERHWRDVHASLVLYARDMLQPQLGGSLRARVEERVVLDSPDWGETQAFYPDVRIEERARPAREVLAKAAEFGTAVAEPTVIRRLEETHTEGFVQIIDTADGNRIISVIEFLSPTNKRRGPDLDGYRLKQQELPRGTRESCGSRPATRRPPHPAGA